MLQKPHTMNREAFSDAFRNATPADLSTSHSVDWGTSMRGQGKRSGGMVMGGMSGAPRGVKIYKDWVGKLPAEERAEIAIFDQFEINVYLRARGAGWGHNDAMDVMLCHFLEGDTHDELKALEERRK